MQNEETKLKIVEGNSHTAKSLLALSVFVLMAAVLLCPGIRLGPDFTLPVEVLLLPAVAYLYFLLVCMGSARPLRVQLFHVFGALFSFSVLVSMLYGSTHFHYVLLIRDYYEVPKMWLPVLFFTVAYEADLNDRAMRRLLTVLGFATLLVCLYGWAQFLDLPGINKLNPYYSGGEHHDLNLQINKRVYSTLGNPNVLGQFLSCVFVCYTLTFLSKVGNRIGSAIIVMTIASTIVLTGSRYALIVSSFGLLFVLGLTLSGAGRAVKLVSFSFLLGILVWSFMATQKTAMEATRRFQELSHPTEVGSLRDRLDLLWIDAFKYFESSPALGHGPAKTIFTGVWTDSEYLDVLKNYGINGFVFYISMYLWVLLQLWRGLRIHRSWRRQMGETFIENLLFVRLGFVLILAALIMNIGMTTYFDWQFNTFFWLIMGLTVRSAHNIEDLYIRLPRDISQPAVALDFRTRVNWI